MNEKTRDAFANRAQSCDTEHSKDWLSRLLKPRHGDFEQRVVCRSEDARWLETLFPGVQLRVLEFVAAERPRLSAQLRFIAGHQSVSLGGLADLEILVQRGGLQSAAGAHEGGMYFRLPDASDQRFDNQLFSSISDSGQQQASLAYIASGHMLETDTQIRRINTLDVSRWLPGPVDGTQVLPLHGHGSGNVMLVRWTESVAFRPRIDPRGEEVLVLEGTLTDAKGSYTADTWLRNPIVAWQSWGAKAGTVIYYKNGHFPNS
ncbi:MAG: cupin domain-containing protein [Granulosicoccus sp.]